MANGPAFADALVVAHANPRLGIGCHVVLADGFPVSPPDTIPSLLGPDGLSFRRSVFDLARALLGGRLLADEIRREALAQVRRLQAAGIRVTHLDTHKHAHLLPGICAPLLQAAAEASVPAIRNPFEPPGAAVSVTPPPYDASSLASSLTSSPASPSSRLFAAEPPSPPAAHSA